MPDLRGLFLRGAGGNAGPLGETQIDIMRPITGRFNAAWIHIDPVLMAGADGAFRNDANVGNTNVPLSGGQGSTHRWSMDTSRLGPNFAGTETRPVNTAVRYLMRALN